MKKIFIDTNVWLRFLTVDDKEKFIYCDKLISLIEEGKIRSYTSNVVLLEVAYTLKTFYRIDQKQIISDIRAIIAGRNMTLIEKTDFGEALILFQKYRLGLADCLIATQLPKGTIFCTYDQDFRKLKKIISLTPEEILSIRC